MFCVAINHSFQTLKYEVEMITGIVYNKQNKNVKRPAFSHFLRKCDHLLFFGF